MGYDGHVEPDGPWIERVDGPVRVRKLSVEEMDNNVYVVSCVMTDKAIVVDTAARPHRLLVPRRQQRLGPARRAGRIPDP